MTRDECLEKAKTDVVSGDTVLPNGCTLYWKTNDLGCREYYTDECGLMVMFWDTTLIDHSSLLAALTQEETLRRAEYHIRADESKQKEKAK